MRRPHFIFAGAVAFSALAGCQVYEVDPVRPAAVRVQSQVNHVVTQVSPNVVFVLDHSGSMVDSAGGDTNGQTKWEDLVQVMAQDDLSGSGLGFVAELAGRASQSDPMHIGVVIFPSDATCGLGGRTLDPTTSDPAGTISQILNGFAPPTGGTPTAASVLVAAQALTTAPQDGRPNYIVLMTDGAPNCNDQWAQVPGNVPDNCQVGTQGCVSGCCYDGNAPPTCGAPNGCLDSLNLVKTIRDIGASPNAIGTFVIGFGTDVSDPSSLAYQTLDQSAEAGGHPQSTEPKFYSATSAQALGDALNAILEVIGGTCEYTLDADPPSPSAVEVVVTPGDGAPVTLANGTEYSVSGRTVTVSDTATSTWCTQISKADADHPITVTVNYIGA